MEGKGAWSDKHFAERLLRYSAFPLTAIAGAPHTPPSSVRRTPWHAESGSPGLGMGVVHAGREAVASPP